MMKVELNDKGEPTRAIAEVSGRYSVYLDTCMIHEFTRRETTTLRARFVAALHKRGTLLFSEANAAEIGRSTGGSAERAAAFLSSIREFWAPLKMSALEILHGSESAGPVSHWFMEACVKRRSFELSEKQVTIDKTSAERYAAEFFDLGAVVGWTADEDRTRAEECARMDDAVREAVKRFRKSYEQDKRSLDVLLPMPAFSPERRLDYVVNGFLRMMTREAKAHPVKKNDGLDFGHATMAMSYASIVALDGAWRDRALALGLPSDAVRVFYPRELEQLVDLFEELVEATPVGVCASR